MTPRIPEPDPALAGRAAPGAPTTGSALDSDPTLPALPGSDSDTALRTAGSTSRRPVSSSGAAGRAAPAVDGSAALAVAPDPGPVTDEEAPVEAGIAELWDAY